MIFYYTEQNINNANFQQLVQPQELQDAPDPATPADKKHQHADNKADGLSHTEEEQTYNPVKSESKGNKATGKGKGKGEKGKDKSKKGKATDTGKQNEQTKQFSGQSPKNKLSFR